jgi:thioesterase domain-containing protein
MDTMEPVVWQGVHERGDVELVIGLAGDVAAQMGRPFSLAREELEGLGMDERFRRAARALHEQGAAPPDFDAEALRESHEVVQARTRSERGYVPGRYAGTLTLFRARDVPAHSEAIFAPCGDEERRTLCWSRLVSAPVEVHVIPGTHVTMGSEPNVRVLAERMREALAAARERAGGARIPALEIVS